MARELYLGLYQSLVCNPGLYCKKHKAYLTQKNIKQRKCNEKKCRYRVTKRNWPNTM